MKIMNINQQPCSFPGCGYRAAVRHPTTGDPLCKGHYQQVRLHPDRPLQPLRLQRGPDFRCERCGKQKRHYAKGRCRNCYMYDLNRRLRSARQAAKQTVETPPPAPDPEAA